MMESTVIITKAFSRKYIDYDVADFKEIRDDLNENGYDIIQNKTIKSGATRYVNARIVAEKELTDEP